MKISYHSYLSFIPGHYTQTIQQNRWLQTGYERKQYIQDRTIISRLHLKKFLANIYYLIIFSYQNYNTSNSVLCHGSTSRLTTAAPPIINYNFVLNKDKDSKKWIDFSLVFFFPINIKNFIGSLYQERYDPEIQKVPRSW